MKRLSRQDVTPRAGAPAAAPKASPAQHADGHGAALGAVRALAGLAVLVSPILLAWGGWTWMKRTPGFAVRRVVVTGTVHASEAAVVALSGASGANAFALDLPAVRERLLRDPWIADAVVRRVLPHELRIAVVEREPAAWEGDARAARVVDATGLVLQESAGPVALALPEIAGLASVPEEQRPERRALGAATLAALKAAAPALWQRATALDVSEAGRLVLVARDCPPIWLSGPQSADEAAAWSRRESSIGKSIGRAAWVDARWRDRLAVMPARS